MDYYYINTTTEYDEVMNWNGEAFIEYSADVEGIKQYDTMEQALAAWDEALQTARDMKAQSLQITKATMVVETMTVSDKVVKRVELKGYKTDISELSKEARELCVFKALAFMQVEDAKQMKRATTQYGVNWGLVF